MGIILHFVLTPLEGCCVNQEVDFKTIARKKDPAAALYIFSMTVTAKPAQQCFDWLIGQR